MVSANTPAEQSESAFREQVLVIYKTMEVLDALTTSGIIDCDCETLHAVREQLVKVVPMLRGTFTDTSVIYVPITLHSGSICVDQMLTDCHAAVQRAIDVVPNGPFAVNAHPIFVLGIVAAKLQSLEVTRQPVAARTAPRVRNARQPCNTGPKTAEEIALRDRTFVEIWRDEQLVSMRDKIAVWRQRTGLGVNSWYNFRARLRDGKYKIAGFELSEAVEA